MIKSLKKKWKTGKNEWFLMSKLCENEGTEIPHIVNISLFEIIVFLHVNLSVQYN